MNTREAVMARFEAGAYERLKTQYGGPGGVNAEAVLDCVIDQCRRKVVRNPTGLLVSQFRKAAKKAGAHVNLSPAQLASEMERYASFQVEIYRLIATSGISPKDLAELLSEAKRNGFTQLNSRTIEQLQSLGDGWPNTESPRKGN